MSEDERPTAAQFKAMPRDHKLEHIIPRDMDGEKFTEESKMAFRAERLARKKIATPREGSRYGKSHTVKSTDIRAAKR